MEMTKQMMKYSNMFEFKREVSTYRMTYVVCDYKIIDPPPKINMRTSSTLNIEKNK